MKELDYYFSALFEQSNRIDYIRYVLLTMTITCLSYSIFAHGYPLYAAAIMALVFQVISWYLKSRVASIRYLANEFQKISMLYRAYGEIPSEFQLSHLKALVSDKISSRVQNKKNNDANETEYNLENAESAREILLSMMHENSYWNHHLYKAVFVVISASLSVIVIGLVITSLFALPLMKIDPEYTIPRLAFTFLSFSLIYEVIEKALKSHSSSKIMLEIDNELTRSRKDISEEHLLKIFNQYCDIKESTPDIPYFLYKSNRAKLNAGWSSRVNLNKNIKNA
ncbi:hypothetical protein MHM87_05590 [Alteromonas sp. Cnat3-28]|uniref:hypothetical protein n=1 Tax=Alteromonas sp. Cnat3-28 TaxID=2917729 RepID=UPI001EF4EA9C|nr:hypothetical protein [Alteromonas sp. Cnat3-28]MCG7645061.1 hypothetical protein [Alteromonas sp. Cnat3-28]